MILEHLRSSCVLALAVALAACGEDALVGDHGEPQQGGQNVEDGRTSEPDDACWISVEYDAIPADDVAFAQSPAIWVEQARGSFGNAAGDTLDIQIPGSAQRREWSCYDDPLLPSPSGPKPYVEFQLPVQISLRTADGAWDERLEAEFTLTPSLTDDGTELQLSGGASLELAELRGSFTLPEDVTGTPDDSVYVRATFHGDGWIVDRVVGQVRPGSQDGESCGCGDLGEAWIDTGLAFVRR
jgi:hypothetical protein